LELDEGVAGGTGDSTLVVLISGHFDEPTISPSRSPGILDQPVVLPVLGPIPNAEDPVVKVLGRALLLNVDSLGIKLEAFVGGIDGNGDLKLHSKLEIKILSR
jgi:hypothetical protein